MSVKNPQRMLGIARLTTIVLAGALVLQAAPAWARISRSPDPYSPIIEFPEGSDSGGSIEQPASEEVPGGTDAGAGNPNPSASVGSLSSGGTTVRVTATVTEEFSLTIRTDGGLSFGDVKPGGHYSLTHIPLMRVQSNRPWVLTDSSATVIENLGGRDYDRARILQHYPTTAFNRIQAPGAYEVKVGYVLNLSDPSLRGLPENTVITADMGYTVVQL